MSKYKPGQSGNPTGGSRERNLIRMMLERQLADPATAKIALEAYVAKLKSGHPVILKDFMDRMLGKAKDVVEIVNAEDNPFKNVTTEEILKLVRPKEPERDERPQLPLPDSEFN